MDSMKLRIRAAHGDERCVTHCHTYGHREKGRCGTLVRSCSTGKDCIMAACSSRCVVRAATSVMRVADTVRNVAVTEGDKVEAQIKFGWEVDAYSCK